MNWTDLNFRKYMRHSQHLYWSVSYNTDFYVWKKKCWSRKKKKRKKTSRWSIPLNGWGCVSQFSQKSQKVSHWPWEIPNFKKPQVKDYLFRKSDNTWIIECQYFTVLQLKMLLLRCNTTLQFWTWLGVLFWKTKWTRKQENRLLFKKRINDHQ